MLGNHEAPTTGRAQTLGTSLYHHLNFSNAWVLRVDGARRKIAGCVALPIAVAAIAASFTLGVRLYVQSQPLHLPSWADRAVLYACVEGLLYIVALASLAFERRAKVAANLGAAAQLLGGGGLGFMGFGIAVGLAWLFGAVHPGPGASGPLAGRLAGMMLGLVLVAFQVMGEELFFHAWLQPILAARWGPAVGVAVTSAVFGAAHAVFKPLGPLALINDTLAGLVFGVIALRSGGLLAPFAAHFAWNGVEQCGLGLTPNPGVDVLGSLFDLDLAGPGLISGGADEMNGALGATLGLGLMLAAALAWRPAPARRESADPASTL